MKNVKYIYNPTQANFYIENGIKCLKTGINPTTNKVFWAFNWYETIEIYKIWCERKH